MKKPNTSQTDTRPKRPNLRSFTVRISQEMADKLEAAAGDEPIAIIVREAIRRHLSKEEAKRQNQEGGSR